MSQEITIGVLETKTINPVHMINNSEVAIATQAGEYLVWTGEDFKLEPMLATSWQKNKDSDEWVFQLRQGVKFHNGDEMTSADVVESFQRLVSEKSLSPAKSVFTFLKEENIQPCGRYCVLFKLDKPLHDFPYMTQHQNAVILPVNYQGDFVHEKAGTGPFMLEDYSPHRGAVLKKNPDYWQQGKPSLDRVIFKIYKSINALILSLQTGAIDGIQEISYLNSLALQDWPGLKISTISSAAHIQLSFKNDRPPFNDERVRRAINMGINRQEIITYFYGGNASKTENHLVPALYGRNLDFAKNMDASYHPPLAKELLKAAGYPNGFDIELVTYTENGTDKIAVILKEMLKKIGVHVKLKIEPPNLYYSHWTDLPFTLSSWSSRNNPSEILNLTLASDSPWNLAAWQNKDFDEALKDYEKAETRENQNLSLQRLIDIQQMDSPVLVLFFPNFLRVSKNEIMGFKNHHASLLDLRECYRRAL